MSGADIFSGAAWHIEFCYSNFGIQREFMPLDADSIESARDAAHASLDDAIRFVRDRFQHGVPLLSTRLRASKESEQRGAFGLPLVCFLYTEEIEISGLAEALDELRKIREMATRAG